MTDFTLETDRLILRDYRAADWEPLHVYGSDPDFTKYELWGPNTIADSQKFVADMLAQARLQPRWKFDVAVTLKAGGLMIGGTGLRREAERSQIGNLGWAITPAQQSQGFATEAARALIAFGFETLKLKLIYATCDTRNVASYRVMEKLGMERVGIIKGMQPVKGYVRDSYRYEIAAVGE